MLVGENGWVDGVPLVFQSKKKTGDYHDEMTAEHFEEWFHDTLLPKLPPNSLIVMDNASYHSRMLEPVPTEFKKATNARLANITQYTLP